METITIRIPEDVLESIDEEATEHGVSRSEYIRELIEKGREYDELKQDRARLERQFVRQHDERQDLIAFIEQKRTWQTASLVTRLKWWLFGKED